MPDDSRCDEEPCRSSVQVLGRAKDAYNARKEDLYQAAAALGFTGASTVALLVFTAEKVVSKFVPVVGWILGVADALLLIALGDSLCKVSVGPGRA